MTDIQSSRETENTFPLPSANQWVLAIASFFLVAFGQPAWAPLAGLIAAVCGYALFWRVLLAHSSWRSRFVISSIWYCAVQLVQLSWFTSHPYAYIYSVYLFIGVWTGIEFGVIGLFITPSLFRSSSTFTGICRLLPIPALWVLFEWSRLFVLSGYSWNPIGLALTGHVYPLQMASLWGVFGLSFWVMFVNLLALRAWTLRGRTTVPSASLWAAAAALPYLYGALHLALHNPSFVETAEKKDKLSALLVQTAIPAEETSGITGQNEMIRHVMNEWKRILEITKKHRGKPIDLIVLPEFVVPFGTYSFVYPLNDVLQIFDEVMGPDSLKHLPSIEYPFGAFQALRAQGPMILVNNAFWLQALSNIFQGDILAGLEDAEDKGGGNREYYSAAIFARPHGPSNPYGFSGERYAKRVLVPMGEYIPFECCKKLAENYGIFGSFTSGTEATVIECRGKVLSPSICYEETYGHMVNEGRRNGAVMLVNLTSDVWYPNSKLPLQHFEHARLRTVENGTPLLRACNTGITGVIDSLGRTVAVLGGDHPEEYEWVADSLLVEVPSYHYPTLYGRFGDWLIVGISVAILILSIFFLRKRTS